MKEKNGLCCMKQHAQATPPWTCDCLCHTVTEETSSHKFYLGDGAYAEFDGYSIVLTTENGIEVTNRVLLGREEWSALKRWAEERNL